MPDGVDLPDGLWAKSPRPGEEWGETLAAHTEETLRRLAESMALRPALPERLGQPRLWHVLFWAALLHDLGKAAAGFQEALRGGRWQHRHEVMSLAFVDWVTTAFTREELPWLVAAVVSHHLDAADIAERYGPVVYGYGEDDETEDQLVQPLAELGEPALRALCRWLPVAARHYAAELGLAEQVSLPQMPDVDAAVASVKLQSVQRVRYWLDTYQDFVDSLSRRGRAWGPAAIALRGHLINADHSASAHAGPRPQPRFDGAAVLASRGLSQAQLLDHQRDAWAKEGSALLTAPTGSGKTEAALLWAACQAARPGGLSRLYYALPHQASMNAMKLRLDGTFGDDMVGLQHGRATLALYRMVADEEETPRLAAKRARHARDLATLNYPPVRVLSPYQMLKAMYRLKGYEAQLSDYHDAAFIFDEIHAYEPQRLAMILGTVRYLAENHAARFFVMSATMPTVVQEKVREALGDPGGIAATPAVFRRFRRHRLQLLDGEVLDEANLARIAATASSGKSVLVTCTWVDRAQQVYRRLSERLEGQGPPVKLLHGRFNMQDRSAKEKLVRQSRGRQPMVLVATQVVEVSLDIDFDTIYSEPAPLEALLQRFGRVNRRNERRRLAPVHVFREPSDGQAIYEPEMIAGTLAVLERARGKAIDESAVNSWLDEVYSGAVLDGWQARYRQRASEFEATCVRTLAPFCTDPQLEEQFNRAFDGIEVLPACLLDEYQRRAEETIIEANELLVPISWKRYGILRGQGRAQPRSKELPPVVDAEYSPELGLTFEEAARATPFPDF